MGNGFNYNVGFMLFLLVSPLYGLKSNELIKNVMYQLQKDMVGKCELKASDVDWCQLPNGLNSTHLEGDMVSFPTSTKCAMRNHKSTDTCVICHKHRWYDTTCGKDFNSHREKRNDLGTYVGAGIGIGYDIGYDIGGSVVGLIGGLIGGIVGAIACIFLCKDIEPYKPPTITCLELPSYEFFADMKELTAVVKWSEPTVKDGTEKTLSPREINGRTSGTRFERGYHTIMYIVTDTAGGSAVCFWNIKVTVRTCDDPQYLPPENSRVLCDSREIIWGSKCKISCGRGYDIIGHNEAICGNNKTFDRSLGHCKAKTCPELQTPTNGNSYTCTEQRNYRSVCSTSCLNGYKIQQSYTRCTAEGTWQLPFPNCQDIEDPKFTDCPTSSKVIYNKPGGLTVTLSYEGPKATDNSGQVTVRRLAGLATGEDVDSGIYTIQYQAEDSARNKAYCSLYIRAEVLECELPRYIDENVKITCDSSSGRYPHGTRCNNSCPTDGYNIQGADEIKCIMDESGAQPRTSWQLQNSNKEPSCLFVKCNNIKAPVNGALVCDTIGSGKFCSYLCEDGYDISLTESFSKVYTCGQSGRWIPPYTNPECSVRDTSQKLRIPVEFTFKGECSQTNEGIRSTFIKALNANPTFSNLCVTTGCSIENVEIWCDGMKIGNQRKKREIGELMVQIDITIPFTLNEESITNATLSHAAKLKGLSDVLTTYVQAGGLNNFESGMTYVADSLKIGLDNFVCPEGQKANYATAACRGCPRGMMYDSKVDDCSNCPIGSYQDETASLSCKLCPNDTSTVEDGTRNSSLCLDKCPIGTNSPTGLEPCGSCPQGTYQDTVGNTKCKICPNEMTSGTRSTTMEDCKVYDVVLTGPVTLQSNTTTNAEDFHVSVWFKFITRPVASAFTINLKRGTNNILTLSFGEEAYVSVSSALELNGMNISDQWNHFILTWKQSTRTIDVYIGGELVKSKTISSVTSGLLVTNTTMEIDVADQHEIIIRRLQFSSSGLLDDLIRNLSKSCDLTTPTQPLISILDLKSDNQNSSNLRIAVPSTCDAIDECLTSPCGQHICINEIGGFKCHCIKGYTGEMCTIAPDYCISNGCMNGATCINDLQYGTFTCDCSQNFTGRLCDVAIVHGGWGEWGDWGQCSTTCGGGQQTRTRICDNPMPEGGGEFCKGIVSSTQTCNNKECPKCLSSDLTGAYGTNIDCNGDVSKLVCKVTCDPGTAFLGDQTTYNCTYGVWAPGTQVEPCIDVVSPDNLQINATLEFPFVPCDKRGDFKNMVSNKISEDTCSGNGLCNSEIKVPECDRANRRRREASTTVQVTLKKSLPGGELNLQAYQINRTVSPQLQAIVEAIQVLELSGQTLQNETDNYDFIVNGENYKAASVNIKGSTICQIGAIGVNGVCVLCPEGTYQNVEICTLCERGYYQDERGQTNCKSCPNGWSTQYIGSMNLTKCSIPSVIANDESIGNTDLVVIIATVVGCIVLLTILLTAFICVKKRWAKQAKIAELHTTSAKDTPAFEMESNSPSQSKDYFRQRPPTNHATD